MRIVTTGVTFAENSAAAASAWPLTSSAVIAFSVVPSCSASARTCVWLVASLSRNCFWTVLPSVLASWFSWSSAWSRSTRALTSASVRDPVSSDLSCVGEIDGRVRPAKLTSSLELPRAPTAIGAACTVPKQVDRCFA